MKRIVAFVLMLSLVLGMVAVMAQHEKSNEDTPDMAVYQVSTPKGQLNVRSKPDAKSAVVAKLSNRSFVQVLGEETGFYQVQLPEDRTGWVAGEFMTRSPYGAEVLSYRPMQIGSSGEDVRALKERLLALGYYRENHSMSDLFNATCVVRVKLFQKQNDLDQTGIATPLTQAVLFSDQAKENKEEIPAPKRTVVMGRHSNLFGNEDFDWNKFAQENPGVCMCCVGKGCECCNFTGRID